MGQTRSIKIRLPDSEDLCLALEPAKSGAMQDAVPVSLRRMPMILGRGRALLVSTLKQEFVHIFRKRRMSNIEQQISKCFLHFCGSIFLVRYSIFVFTVYKSWSARFSNIQMRRGDHLNDGADPNLQEKSCPIEPLPQGPEHPSSNHFRT